MKNIKLINAGIKTADEFRKRYLSGERIYNTQGDLIDVPHKWLTKEIKYGYSEIEACNDIYVRKLQIEGEKRNCLGQKYNSYKIPTQ